MRADHFAELLGVSSRSPVFGDLGCGAVDIEAFKRANRVPLFPGKWNRWILARTTRDEPNLTDLKRSLRGVFNQWLKTQGAMPWDGVFPYHLGAAAGPNRKDAPTSRHGDVDLLYLMRVSQDQPALAPSSVAKMENGKPALRRYVTPMPTIQGSKPPVFLLVEFVPRGINREQWMPWPAHRVQVFNPWCPEKADWALWAVLPPEAQHVPPERTELEKYGREVTRAGSRAVNALGFSSAGLWVLAGGVTALWLAHKLRGSQ